MEPYCMTSTVIFGTRCPTWTEIKSAYRGNYSSSRMKRRLQWCNAPCDVEWTLASRPAVQGEGWVEGGGGGMHALIVEAHAVKKNYTDACFTHRTARAGSDTHTHTHTHSYVYIYVHQRIQAVRTFQLHRASGAVSGAARCRGQMA
jgi:hypothetical protein